VHTDQRSDIYALGATLYHLLTGQAPISVTRRTSEPSAFRPPRQARADISPEVEQVILRAMEIERAKRFATAADMHAALNLARQPYLVDATRTTDLTALAAVPAHPDRRRRALALIAVPILLFLGVAIGIALQANTGSVESASTTTPTLTPTPTSTSTASSTPTRTPTTTPTLSATMAVTLPVAGGTPSATALPGASAVPNRPAVTTPAAPARPSESHPRSGQTKDPPGQDKTKGHHPAKTRPGITAGQNKNRRPVRG
jgi:serine/threonine-protein kinase